MANLEGYVPLPDGRTIRYVEIGDTRRLYVTPDGGTETQVEGPVALAALEADMAGHDATSEVSFIGDTPPSEQRS